MKFTPLADEGLLGVIILIIGRIAAILFTAPLFAEQPVSWRIRLGLVVTLSWLVAPSVIHGTSAAVSDNALDNRYWACALAGEILQGVLLGLGAGLLLYGLQYISSCVVFDGGDDLDEAWGSNPWRVLFRWLALLIFMEVGGHRHVVGALLHSFQQIPIGNGPFAGQEGAIGPWIGNLLHESCTLAIAALSPIYCAVLFSSVIVAALGRCLSQIQLTLVSASVRTFTILLALCIALHVVCGTYVAGWSACWDRLQLAWNHGEFLR